jgi:BirA family transcriptional regulator, biotin operon repressor / biotin---[acetyl-CoA-carboxylase] ligase
MTVINSIHPASLQKYLWSHELLERKKSPHLPPPETILRYGAFVGSAIQCHASLERTMEHARRHIADSESQGLSVISGTVILADTLIQSKGRFARSWHAPPGGLWGCVILADTFLSRARTLLPLALGVACCEAVRGLGIPEAHVRWVNDVLVRGQKLAGFLVESHRGPRQGEAFHLLGFGININNDSFPAELTGNAISLRRILDGPVDLPGFSLSFLAKLAWNIGLLCHEEERELHRWDGAGEGGNQAGHLLLDQWMKLSDTIGKKVLYGYDIQQKPLYEAVVTGINSDGAIVMRLGDGNEIVEYGGELLYLETDRTE